MQLIQRLDSLQGMDLTFKGTPPTARNIDGLLPPKSGLTAKKVSPTLVRGGSFKCRGTYVGVMPAGSVHLGPTDELKTLVPGLRLFFVGSEDDVSFSFKELEVATPQEIREAEEVAVELARGQAKKARCKENLHHCFDHLFRALAVLLDCPRLDLPQCSGNCSYGTCTYSMETFVWKCDTEGIDPLDVLKVAATAS
ncbi:MAG TPA: hypothetical protein VFO38_00250 [Candidatus Saccharimonadales bacterium]|nr:hypothetical protein [Candidatus Saccharimonadales bacterium]